MNPTPIIDMFSGTASIRLAGNAVNDTKGNL